MILMIGLSILVRETSALLGAYIVLEFLIARRWQAGLLLCVGIGIPLLILSLHPVADQNAVYAMTHLS